MAIHIGRREAIVALAGAAAWPLEARAQRADRMWRISVLMNTISMLKDKRASQLSISACSN